MSKVQDRPRAAKSARPLSVSLIVEINGTAYGVEPIDPGESGSKAFRLAKRSPDGAVYDVIRTHAGLVECDCPHYEARIRGLSCEPCKHGSALVAVGLMPAPAPNFGPIPAPAPAVSAADRLRAAAFGIRLPAEAPEPFRCSAGEAGICPACEAAPDVRQDDPEPSADGSPGPEPAACCGPDEAAPCVGCAAESWPTWTDSFTVELPAEAQTPPWSDEPDTRDARQAGAYASGPRFDLAGLIDAQATAYASWLNSAGDLIASHLRELAAEVRFLGAATPEAFHARREVMLDPTDAERIASAAGPDDGLPPLW